MDIWKEQTQSCCLDLNEHDNNYVILWVHYVFLPLVTGILFHHIDLKNMACLNVQLWLFACLISNSMAQACISGVKPINIYIMLCGNQESTFCFTFINGLCVLSTSAPSQAWLVTYQIGKWISHNSCILFITFFKISSDVIIQQFIVICCFLNDFFWHLMRLKGQVMSLQILIFCKSCDFF